MEKKTISFSIKARPYNELLLSNLKELLLEIREYEKEKGISILNVEQLNRLFQDLQSTESRIVHSAD